MVCAFCDSGAVLSVLVSFSFSALLWTSPGFLSLKSSRVAGLDPDEAFFASSGSAPSPPGPPAASSFSNFATPSCILGRATSLMISLTLLSSGPSPPASTLASCSSPAFSSAM